ncbi:MAG: copper homeostasis membrane protein CopD [Caulobacteraceae bacterium]|uniref:Copper homeostasis membrane protein CopD n=1 Tax=Brevundimonas staleyi TaxID=74326 RepID=A0ABW0FR93_9CAUL|nr:copper homeostasis membrane protein CopD [Brevundimonas diminuta]MBX9707500.1 copper homeostasis membrane protein CopD [Caulobacteraceae bacterium]MDM8354059.1 copper homeostasis membrane protein CopD [Brevundimonas diminuta]
MLDLLVIGLRLAQYGGAVILLGTPLFLLYGLRGPDAVAQSWARGLLIGACAVVAVASALALVAQTSVMAGSIAEGLKPASLGFMITGTSLGPAFLLRVGLGLTALTVVLLGRPSRFQWGLLVLAGLLVSASFAWTGHGAATEGAGRYPHLLSTILHSWAAALWLGALVALWIMTAGHRPGDFRSDQVLHRALHGFAGVGSAAVAVLILSGLVNSWFMVGIDRIDGLVTTPYGWLLLFKLLLFGLMLALAASNRFQLTPDLLDALDDPDDVRLAIGRLKRSLRVETFVALALLAVVAVMGTLAPVSAMDMAM